MYRKMLVPLDGSHLAEAVFPYVTELAGRLDLEVIILHVCTPEEQSYTSMHRSYVEQNAEIMKRQSVKVQQVSGVQLENKAVEVRGDLVVGYPAEEILQYSAANKVDFILMATHGHSGIKRWTISSVADKVLRSSRIPVFLVRSDVTYKTVYDEWPRKTFIVPLDGSNYAESVLPHIEILAKQRGIGEVNVVLLTVCERQSIPANLSELGQRYGWDEYIDQMTCSLKEMSEHYLSGVEKRLRDTGLKVKSRVLMGNPAHKIIEFTRRHPFSLIVMTTHGHSGYVQWSFGNVADKVLHRASSPTFLIRT